MQNLNRDYQYFTDHRADLLKSYSGKFIVISDEKVVGAYDDEQTAYNDSVEKFGLGNFLIQKCVAEKDEPRAIFHSRVVFA